MKGVRYKLKNKNDEVVAAYLNGLTTSKLATIYGVRRLAILRLLKRNNIPLRPTKGKLENNLSDIINEYKAGIPIRQIASKYNADDVSIFRRLQRAEVYVPQKNNYRTYELNERYFDRIDSEDKAYFLGFLYADGCYTPQHNRIHLGLHEKDMHILESFRKHLEYTGPIRNKPTKRGNQKLLVIQSAHLTAMTLKWGVKHNKTFDLDFPYWLNADLMHHFIRGFFDGDGTVGVYDNQYNFAFIGYVNFLESLRQHLEGVLGMRIYQYPYRKSQPKTVVIQQKSRIAAIAFADYIYKDATLYLHRKKAIFDAMPRQLPITLKPPKSCLSCADTIIHGLGYCSKHYYEFIRKPRAAQSKLNLA